MKVFQDKVVNTEVDRICDVCNESVSVEINGMRFIERGELKASFGYGSNDDGKVYHLDLCETCFKIALNTLKEHRKTLLMPDHDSSDEHFGLDKDKNKTTLQ